MLREIWLKTLCFSSRSGALLHAVSVFLPVLPEYLIVLPVPLRGSIEQSVHRFCSEIGFLTDNHHMGNFSSSRSCHCRIGWGFVIFPQPIQYKVQLDFYIFWLKWHLHMQEMQTFMPTILNIFVLPSLSLLNKPCDFNSFDQSIDIHIHIVKKP